MTHEQLCERARRWLSGTKRCEPVFSNIASCREIPDAIGWSSCYQWLGSTVVECKTSAADFHADRRKHYWWKHPTHDWHFSADRFTMKEVEQGGYIRVPRPSMGNYRFYMCKSGVLRVELVEKYMPDHGLLYVDGRRVIVMREAPRREDNDKDAEIRYLRFAIKNRKVPYGGTVTEQPQLPLGSTTQ